MLLKRAVMTIATMNRRLLGAGLLSGILTGVAGLTACGGQVSPASTPEDGTPDEIRSEESAALKWWNSAFTSQRWQSFGWQDTDLAVKSSTPVQLRHASKLIDHGVYGWGYMPTFIDTVTGDKFRFLHLRPQHQWATHIDNTYPAGFIVGVSGGDTSDTGLGVYSTGPHLCVQTVADFRSVFPAGQSGGGGSNPGAPPSSGGSCYSKTLNRTVGESTCVQSSSDSNWYTCQSGQWMAGQHTCGINYGFCHSATLGRSVPARTCVESKLDKTWYQCSHDGWDAPVDNGAGVIGTCSAEYRL